MKCKLQVNDLTRNLLFKSYNSAVIEVDGYEKMSCVEKDYRNYMEQVRRIRLGKGNVVAIQSYFSKIQTRCSRFYFSMDLDGESQLKMYFRQIIIVGNHIRSLAILLL